jgi:hypothetical protein
LLISILGLVIGHAQTVGSLLIIIGGRWIAWSVVRRHPTVAVEPPAQPSHVS